MFGLIPSPTRFTGRTAHRKSARRAENHFHTDRSHGVACRGTIHHKRCRLRGDRSKIIAHHKGVISIVQGAIYILDHELGPLPPQSPAHFYTIGKFKYFPSAREVRVMSAR